MRQQTHKTYKNDGITEVIHTFKRFQATWLCWTRKSGPNWLLTTKKQFGLKVIVISKRTTSRKARTHREQLNVLTIWLCKFCRNRISCISFLMWVFSSSNTCRQLCNKGDQ